MLRALSLEPEPIESWLKRHGEAGLQALADTAEREGGEAAEMMLAQALSERDERRRTGLCNEALSDLEAALSRYELAPSAAMRLMVFSTTLGLVLAVRSGDEVGPKVLDVLTLGVGAVVTVLAGRRAADRVATRQRKAIDRWVHRSLLLQGASPAAELQGGPRTGSRTKLTDADVP